MSYRWLRVPMLGAVALTMTLATTGAAQASPRGADGHGQARYDAAYREIDYRSGYNDRDDRYNRNERRGDRRVMYRGGRRVVVVYVRPHSRYDRYHRYHRYHRYDRYDRW